MWLEVTTKIAGNTKMCQDNARRDESQPPALGAMLPVWRMAGTGPVS